MIKAAPEHLRHASTEEFASLSECMEGLSELRQELRQDPAYGYIDLHKENENEEPPPFDEEREGDHQQKLQPKFRLEGKTPRKEIIPREEHDHWQMTDQGEVKRIHREARRATFFPTDAEDCPVPIEQLSNGRTTTRNFVNKKPTKFTFDFNWREAEREMENDEWTGETEFYLKKVDQPPEDREQAVTETPEEEEREPPELPIQPDLHEQRSRTLEDEPEAKRVRRDSGAQGADHQEGEGDQPPELDPEDLDLQDGQGLRREREEGDEDEPGAKRTKLEWIEVLFQGTMKALEMKQKKEITYAQLDGLRKACFDIAIAKEIRNNLNTGAYEFLDLEESERIRREEGQNILQSRYVLVEKLLEADEIENARQEGILVKEENETGHKAKARHVMKGFSEEGSEWLDAATPQVAADSMMLILQILSTATASWMDPSSGTNI